MSMLRGKCSIVFTGHSHERVIENFGGVEYISIEDYLKTQTYCLVNVKDSGVSYRFIKL
jgi:predicted phosphodiesterase